MQQQNHHRKKNRQQFWLDVFLNSFCAVFFSLFFVFAQASDAGSTIQNGETEDGSTSVAGARFSIDHNQLFHFPLSSFPAPTEQETKDEREASDNSDDEPGKLFTTLSLKERFGLSSHKSLLLQLLHSRENRKEVSLFILHHSWKSFLS